MKMAMQMTRCCRSRYSASFSQNDPRRICLIPPPLLTGLVSLDDANTPAVLITAATGQEQTPTLGGWVSAICFIAASRQVERVA
jgi:hypothetical protein